MDYVSIECDGKDYTKELKDCGVSSIMFLNIKVCINITISELCTYLIYLGKMVNVVDRFVNTCHQLLQEYMKLKILEKIVT